MLKRLYFVLSVLWALVFLAKGATKRLGVQGKDPLLAAPGGIRILSWRMARFVVQGS